MIRVITFGTFDLLHVGHVRILERAAGLGDELAVGISSDQLNYSKKGKYPIYSESSRREILKAVKFVDRVFTEKSLELKREYILAHKANILVMGDDWKGEFDCLRDICDVVYLERTPSVSTTAIVEQITINRVEDTSAKDVNLGFSRRSVAE